VSRDDQKIANHYRALFAKHGDSPKSLQWFDEQSQEKRFEVLAAIGDLNGASMLDFGCGLGRFARYLKKRNVSVTYTGVDLVPEMRDHAAREHPEHRFCRPEELGGDLFDYAFISGVFNNKRRDNERFFRETAADSFARAKRGLAFNMLCVDVDRRYRDLSYAKPEKVLRFVKKHLSPLVTLRNDYCVQAEDVPSDFTVYVYRRQGIPETEYRMQK
jgi:SAM-dependent methyltransferase